MLILNRYCYSIQKHVLVVLEKQIPEREFNDYFKKYLKMSKDSLGTIFALRPLAYEYYNVTIHKNGKYSTFALTASSQVSQSSQRKEPSIV